MASCTYLNVRECTTGGANPAAAGTDGSLTLMEIEGCADWSEILTGLGATGASLILAVTQRATTAHPFIPTIFCTERPGSALRSGGSSGGGGGGDGSEQETPSVKKTVSGGFFRDADFIWDALDWRTETQSAAAETAQVSQMQAIVDGVLRVLTDVASGTVQPKVQARGATHFQIYRGLDGHSV